MALIHWDKSVLSLHLREIIEDHHQGNANALVGLGAILLGTTVIPAAAKLGRPLLKNVIKSSLSLYEESKSTAYSSKTKLRYSPSPSSLNRVNHYQNMKIPVELKN